MATAQVVGGKVTVKREGERVFIPLAVRGALYVGDVVHTGAEGKASLLFGDGSQLRLNENSQIEIGSPVAHSLIRVVRVLFGRIWARLRPGRGVQAGSAFAGAEGTEFHLTVANDGTTTLTVLAGEARFSNLYGEVVVGESQQSVASPVAAPTAPIRVDVTGIIQWTLDLDRAIIAREKFFIGMDRRSLESEIQRRGERARSQPDNPEARSLYGDALFDSGKFEEALREYEESSRLAPAQAATLTRIGNALLELGRLDEAEASFHAALDRDPQHAPALVGLAWLALARNHPGEAQAGAERAVAADGNSAEAHISLGLAHMRQPGRLAEAAKEFEAALRAEPAAYHYQARAWLALVYLAQDNPQAASKEGVAAVQMAPQSALAHGNLALVYFFSGKAPEAEAEARLALKHNPDSVPARCALGQALLAQGDVEAATRMAAQAIALDPRLPQARYILGIAHAQRRDFTHASRELEECLTLAPDFLPAASALARVYTTMGREQEAIAVLNNLLPHHRNSDGVLAALGMVYYQQGKYEEAAAQYEKAVQLRPNSPLYRAELARLLMDANRLNEAIAEGQEAVRLAPEVGQYHAILGLAYNFSRLSLQGEREFRTALALDPQNALAHLVLGLKATRFDPGEQRIMPKTSGMSLTDLLRQGLQAVGSTPAVSSIAQAFLYDPAISTQVLRGGIAGESTPSGGSGSPLNSAFTYGSIGNEGLLHSFGLASREEDTGMRTNDDVTALSLSENVTFVHDPRTIVFARVSRNRNEQGSPGPVSLSDENARVNAKDNLVQLAMKRRIGVGNYLWLGLSRPAPYLELLDPDMDRWMVRIEDEEGNGVWVSTQRQEIRSDNFVPELRLEFALNRKPSRPAILTLGATRASVKPTFKADLVWSSGPPPEITPFVADIDGRLFVAYAQLTQTVNDRLCFAAQLRQQRLDTTTTADLLGGGQSSVSEGESYSLPSLLANYRADNRTLLRLFYNRQAQGQDLTTIALTPLETVLTTEPLVMPKGSPKETETVELDAERYLGPTQFLKLFLFHTSAKGVNLGELPTMERVKRNGWGLRYEQQLGRNLFGQAAFLMNRTMNDTPFAPFDDGTAPYHPARLAGLSLNYVDRTGSKVGLQLNYSGAFFQDTGNMSAPDRPIFPARTYMDLTLAKEPSVHKEFFLRVSNLLNSRAIQFNDFPTGRRRLLVGVTLRF